MAQTDSGGRQMMERGQKGMALVAWELIGLAVVAGVLVPRLGVVMWAVLGLAVAGAIGLGVAVLKRGGKEQGAIIVGAALVVGLVAALAGPWAAREMGMGEAVTVVSVASSSSVTGGAAHSAPIPLAVVASTQPVPTEQEMAALADRIIAGDPAATKKLEVIATDLYRGINYQQEQERVMTNLGLMKAAYDKLGEAAGGGNAKAMDALQYSLKSRSHLRSFAPDALGMAAAAGNKQAMDLLLDYKKYGMLLSSTVFAMAKPAETSDPRAVKFLIDVTKDPKSKGLWDAAHRELQRAVDAGNADAKTAVEQLEANADFQAMQPNRR